MSILNTTLPIALALVIFTAACGTAPAPLPPAPPEEAPAEVYTPPPKPDPPRSKIVAVDSSDEAYTQGEQLEQAAQNYGLKVQELLAEHQEAINQCYLRQLKKNPELRGSLVVNLLVQPGGQLSQSPSFTENTLQNPKIEGCVRKLLQTLSYPEPYNKDYAKVEHMLQFGAF